MQRSARVSRRCKKSLRFNTKSSQSDIATASVDRASPSSNALSVSSSGWATTSSSLGGSRLLTFDSTEHTAYTKNDCIDTAVDDYLLHGTLPREGTQCRSSS